MPDSSQLSAYLANIMKCREVFSMVIGNGSFRSLVIVGKMEDQGEDGEVVFRVDYIIL